MIKIEFDPDLLKDPVQKAWWNDWQQRAEEATCAAVLAFEDWLDLPLPRPKFTHKFNDKIWKELKDWMLEHVLHGKCAYCETKAIRHSDHAEHYRPKGSVSRRLGSKWTRVKVQTPSGETIEHPGYFWLAYDWHNILPSCEFCNSGPAGKNTRFPLSGNSSHVLLKEATDPSSLRLPRNSRRPNFYYFHGEDLNALEGPTLIHPCDRVIDPRQHIHFEEFGVEVGDTERGIATIEIFDLKSKKLREARRTAQEVATTSYLLALTQAVKGGRAELKAKADSFIATYADEKREYSAAVRDWLMALQNEKF